MYKVLTFLKRRADLSAEEFMDRYENGHAKLGEKYLRGNAVRYIRRYLNPMTHELSEEGHASEYDAIMEMWFEDKAQFDRMMEILAQPDVVNEVVEHGHTLFDRSLLFMYHVDEKESELGPVNGEVLA